MTRAVTEHERRRDADSEPNWREERLRESVHAGYCGVQSRDRRGLEARRGWAEGAEVVMSVVNGDEDDRYPKQAANSSLRTILMVESDLVQNPTWGDSA